MVQRVPDEVFRKRSAGPAKKEGRRRRARSVVPKEVAEPLRKLGGMSVRSAVLLAVAVLVGAFLLGRLVLFPTGSVANPAPSPGVATSSPTGPSQTAMVVYDADETDSVSAAVATDGCPTGDAYAYNLIDSDLTTIWRCQGDGDGATITFDFDSPVELVGVKVSNGNKADEGRYAIERRITSIRWDFSDGSYFEQGLAANELSSQEVRFPPIDCDQVTLTVLSSTEPGAVDDDSDAVSISDVGFLTADR